MARMMKFILDTSRIRGKDLSSAAVSVQGRRYKLGTVNYLL